MKIDIPFELGELVYVIGKEKSYEREYIPESSYNVGVDWVRVPAHYDTHVIFRKVVKCVNFKFGLLDRYKVSEIFRNREDAETFLKGDGRMTKEELRMEKHTDRQIYDG